MAHIYGADPFPWPKPYGGGLSGIDHISPPYVLAGSPKAVLTKCSMFWRVINVQLICSLGTFTLCIAI